MAWDPSGDLDLMKVEEEAMRFGHDLDISWGEVRIGHHIGSFHISCRDSVR